MSTRTVAWKDFRSVNRARSLWAAGTLLAVLMAVIAYGYEPYQAAPADAITQLFDLLSMGLAVFLPLIALVASSMAIVGERESGGIKFLLSVPNTRRNVFLGKLVSRLGLVGAGVGFMFLPVTIVALAKYGTLPLTPVFGVVAVSLVYALVFVCIAVAVSAAVSTRSRAIAASIGAYFVLVVLYAIPLVRIADLVRWVHHTMLGFQRNPDLYAAVSYTSPYIAFRKASNLVFPTDYQSVVFHRSAEQGAQLPMYLADEVSLVVFVVWFVVPLGLGYLRFDRTDID